MPSVDDPLLFTCQPTLTSSLLRYLKNLAPQFILGTLLGICIGFAIGFTTALVTVFAYLGYRWWHSNSVDNNEATKKQQLSLKSNNATNGWSSLWHLMKGSSTVHVLSLVALVVYLIMPLESSVRVLLRVPLIDIVKIYLICHAIKWTVHKFLA